MLTQIRERATGWIAWVIVILITIPFALWGIQSYFEGASEIPVATVNGEEISTSAYQNELSRQRRARQITGAADLTMRNQVVESMISNRLMNQYVNEHNYRLSDDELKRRIETDTNFLRDGKFDSEQYRDLLRANGHSPQSYEAVMRQNAAIEQLYSSLADSSFVTEAEVNRLLALQTQTRKTDYVVLSANRFEDEIDIDEAKIEQQYRDNLSDYEAPARMKVDYIELSVENLAQGVEPSDAEISETYEQTIERYKQAETRKASHILFSVESSASEQERDEILAQAETVLAEAQADADFAELAKTHSGDPGSKEKGGDLGVVTRGQMVPPFEEAVFSMVADEIRGPVETRFGYHIIKLTELTEERQKPLDEAREEVAAEARRIQAENQFAELGEAFQNLVFEDSESLATAADELGLVIQQSDWFTESEGADHGVTAEAQVRRAAFSEDVRNDDLNSAAIELGFDRMVAVRKASFEAAHPKPLDEVRDQIKQRLTFQKSSGQSRELGDKLVADLSTGQLDWDALLTQQQLESQALAEQRDQVPGNLAALGDAVFSHPAPDDGAVAYNGVSVGNGDYAIYALKEVAHGNVDDADQSRRTGLQEQLLARDGYGFYRLLQDTIRQSAEVVINRPQIENPENDFQ